MTARGGYRHPVDRPGLQGERTELAWERTALGLFAASALLLFHRVGPGAARVLLVVADVALGLVLIWFGRRRGRQVRVLRAGPDGRTTVAHAGREVVGAGLAVAVVSVGTALVLAFRA